MNDVDKLFEEFGEAWPEFQTYLQLGIVLLDSSLSMADIESSSGLTKAVAVAKAYREMAERLQNSDMHEQFLLSTVTFDDNVQCPLPPTFVDDVDDSDLELDLLAMHGRNTAIGDALEKAGQIAEQFLADEDPDGAIPRYVVILLMSDGQSNTGSDPRDVVRKLKEQFSLIKPHGPELVLAAAAYGDDADENLLREIATDESRFERVDNGEELRDFFFHTISVSMAAMEMAAD